jgi:hypothetical protein
LSALSGGKRRGIGRSHHEKNCGRLEKERLARNLFRRCSAARLFVRPPPSSRRRRTWFEAQTPIASLPRSRYIRRRRSAEIAPEGEPMRAEIQNIVDEIKQSIGLLRRHL